MGWPIRQSRHATRRPALAAGASASPARPGRDRIPRLGPQWHPAIRRVCAAPVSAARHFRPLTSAWHFLRAYPDSLGCPRMYRLERNGVARGQAAEIRSTGAPHGTSATSLNHGRLGSPDISQERDDVATADGRQRHSITCARSERASDRRLPACHMDFRVARRADRYLPNSPGTWKPWVFSAYGDNRRLLGARPADVKAFEAQLLGLNAIIKQTEGFAKPMGFSVETAGTWTWSRLRSPRRRGSPLLPCGRCLAR